MTPTLREGFRKIFGNGRNTFFWDEVWAGGVCLKERFPRLFRLSCKVDAAVEEMEVWEDGARRWELRWRRELSIVNEFIAFPSNFEVQQDIKDKLAWNGDSSSVFTVKKAYANLTDQTFYDGDNDFVLVWHKLVPTNICAFAWKLVLNKIPTRTNLSRRGVALEPDTVF
ncbi:hypothetical protein SLE2022_339790 [Rubroshorea leprosula]